MQELPDCPTEPDIPLVERADRFLSYLDKHKEQMDYPPHQQRVLQEKTELDTRANALSAFIGLNPVFDKLDLQEQERLKIQNDLMWQLSEVLGERIAAFTAN